MTNTYETKFETLKRRLRSLESAVVAFSGGVDSSVLVAVAHEALGSRMIAVTADSPSLPRQDRLSAARFCSERGIPHTFVTTLELDDPRYAANPEDRCYFCKKYLMEKLVSLADERGFRFIVEGTNAEDLGGHRPGNKASRELTRVVTPLIEAGFTKDDVRLLARELGLPTADKPSAACLASRVPTGERITAELLARIDQAEESLRALGALQVRVRHHGELARIEVAAGDMELCIGRREDILSMLRELGWKFVTLDLAGYRTGGMRG
ncbi:MAG: ATP-dependent sacrificial sulfur transferase LarE [bacterium]